MIFITAVVALFGCGVWYFLINYGTEHFASILANVEEAQISCVLSLTSLMVPLTVIDAIADTKLPGTNADQKMGEEFARFKQMAAQLTT